MSILTVCDVLRTATFRKVESRSRITDIIFWLEQMSVHSFSVVKILFILAGLTELNSI